jgi:hypothetical protein
LCSVSEIPKIIQEAGEIGSYTAGKKYDACKEVL